MGRDVANSQTWEAALHRDSTNYEKAKASMNRGYALASQKEFSAWEAAGVEYTKAIQLLDTLRQTPPVSNSLGAALMNRSQLQHRIYGTSKSHLTIEGYLRAESVLRSCLDDSNRWPRRNLVGTLINHANLLLDLHQPEKSKSKAEEAFANLSFEKRTDPTDCELAVLAARAFCDAVGQILPKQDSKTQETLASQAEEKVRKGLSHILILRPHLTVEPFPAASVRLFHFGCQLIATYQPTELEGFITLHIQNLSDREVWNQYLSTANVSIRSALNQIGEIFLISTVSDRKQDLLAATSQRLGKLHAELNNRPI